jgi:hypothetical protein
VQSNLHIHEKKEWDKLWQEASLAFQDYVQLTNQTLQFQPQVRKEMVAWLKANYTKVKIVALNLCRDQLVGADYNLVLNDHEEWPSLLAAAAS